MSNDYHRRAYIRGVNLETVDGLSIDTIRPDAAPDRNITSSRLAFDDGEVVLRANYGNKMIYVNGHINTPDRWDYEASRDQLLGLLDSEQEVDIVFEQSGQQRKYTGLYESLTITYVERGLSTFVINFRATQPFAETVEETVPIAGEVMDDNTYQTSFFINGNVYTFPRVVLVLDDYNVSTPTPTTITIEVQSEGKTMQLALTYQFAAGQTVVIDGGKPQATVNGITIPYVGRFPRGRRITSLRVTHTADSASINLQVRYNERNM